MLADNMNDIQNALVGVLTIWLVGLGMAIMFKWQAEYISWTKKLFVHPLLRFLKKIWGRYKKEIIILAIGIVIGIAITRSFTTLSRTAGRGVFY